MKKLTLFLNILIILSCSSGQQKEDSATEKKLRGFEQFPIYQGNELLGYIPSEKNLFNYKVWEGRIRKAKVEQTITVDYSNEQEFAAGLKLLNISSAKIGTSAEIKNLEKLRLKMINPSEIILENPFPSPRFHKKTEFLDKPFISALLRVDSIEMELVTKEGKAISGEAIAPFFEANTKYISKQDLKSLQTAKNVYVGYKLHEPMANAERLTPMNFQYTMFHRPSKTGITKKLNIGDEVKSGEGVKVDMRSSQEVFVYLFNIDSQGNVYVVFPNNDPKCGKLCINPVTPNAKYEFPENPDNFFELDDNKGKEEFLFLVFREENPELDSLVKKINSTKGFNRKDFEKANVVINTKGIKKISNMAEPGKTIRKEELPTGLIEGLPHDYKESFYFFHR
jgi:hypothetical protein